MNSVFFISQITQPKRLIMLLKTKRKNRYKCRIIFKEKISLLTTLPHSYFKLSSKGRSLMEKEYLDLKLDFMFKQLFGQKNRKHITIAFLNDLLGRKGDNRFTDLHFENTENVKDRPDGKTVIFDVTVFTSFGERINIEIQLINQQNMPERTLYYWSRMFSSSLNSRRFLFRTSHYYYYPYLKLSLIFKRNRAIPYCISYSRRPRGLFVVGQARNSFNRFK